MTKVESVTYKTSQWCSGAIEVDSWTISTQGRGQWRIRTSVPSWRPSWLAASTAPGVSGKCVCVGWRVFCWFYVYMYSSMEITKFFTFILLPVCTVRATKPKLTVCCMYQQSITVHIMIVRNMQWLKNKAMVQYTLRTKLILCIQWLRK